MVWLIHILFVYFSKIFHKLIWWNLLILHGWGASPPAPNNCFIRSTSTSSSASVSTSCKMRRVSRSICATNSGFLYWKGEHFLVSFWIRIYSRGLPSLTVTMSVLCWCEIFNWSCMGSILHRVSSGMGISLKYFLFVVRTMIDFFVASTVTAYVSNG